MCLSGVQRRGHGSYNDEYLSEGAHSTPTTRETWCRGKDPHTGPKAFNAMRHNEEEKSMHNNQCTTITPSTEARQQGRRRKQRYPEGGTSKTWTKAPRRNIRGGVRVTSGREQSPQTRKRQKEAPTANVALQMVKSNGGVS